MAFKRECEVAVIGAGPVGLLTAIGLKSAGVDVRIFDAGRRTSVHSYALVLHAATLDLLDRVGLGASCVEAGMIVKRLAIYETSAPKEALDLTKVGGPYRHVVVLPQSRLEEILEAALEKQGLAVEWDHRAQSLEPAVDRIALQIARLDKVSTGYPVAHTEVVVDKLHDLSARYVIGADGYDSFVRRRLGIPFGTQGPGDVFSVFQFVSGGDVPREGRLTIAAGKVGGFWPLPGGACRFSFPVATADGEKTDPARLAELLAAHAPWFVGAVGAIEWGAVGAFERKLVGRFGEGRVWLAGDAAHLAGPLGAQSMNIGLREGADLADRIARALRSKNETGLLDEYGSQRLAEWRPLVAPAGSRRALLTPCIPASGKDLEALLSQLAG